MSFYNLSQQLIGPPGVDKGGADGYVLFDTNSKTNTAIVQVTDMPIVLKAYNLTSGQTVTVNNFYPGTSVSAPYIREGSAVVLQPTDNTEVLFLTGYYQLVFSGTPGTLTLTATQLNTPRKPGEVTAAGLRSEVAFPNPLLGGTNILSTKQQIGPMPWVFRAYGLSGDETIAVLNVYSANGVDTVEPCIIEGVVQELTATNNSLVLDLAGYYQFQIGAPIEGLLLIGHETAAQFLDPYTLEESQAAATQAAASAVAAANSDTNAQNQAAAAAASAGNASSSATNAAASASSAATSATSATTEAGIATTQAGIATTQATNASNSATAAAGSAATAGTDATNAAASAAAALVSQNAAATSATTAGTDATNAGNSATAAAASATTASTAATTATTEAGIATTQAGTATTQASAASTSATNAATSASGAATSASGAATSASGAATSATTATTQATAAAASATAAAASASIPEAALTSVSGVLTVNLAATTKVYYCTLHENVTSWVFNNPPAAGYMSAINIVVTQAASGGPYTCASPATSGYTAGGAWTVSATASKSQWLDLYVSSSGIVKMNPEAVLS
jgi:hypothetical protein